MPCRSLHWERGLKYSINVKLTDIDIVVPYIGNVDWNTSFWTARYLSSVVPYIGNVDWNAQMERETIANRVVPYIGNVDWNDWSISVRETRVFRRSLHWERGLKSFLCFSSLSNSCRSLHWERGLKWKKYYGHTLHLGRSLHWKRGVKYNHIVECTAGSGSFPTLGTWIEI